ncbi:hypothetical protein V6N13_065360 [Hibiscus sabdariffa]
MDRHSWMAYSTVSCMMIQTGVCIVSLIRVVLWRPMMWFRTNGFPSTGHLNFQYWKCPTVLISIIWAMTTSVLLGTIHWMIFFSTQKSASACTIILEKSMQLHCLNLNLNLSSPFHSKRPVVCLLSFYEGLSHNILMS